ncbi:MAG: hypothetical protein R3E79_27080 [Caldilineaceae bacterium]
MLFTNDKGVTTSDLKRTIKAITGSELSNQALTERMEEALSELDTQGHIGLVSRARYRVTDPGCRHILSHLALTTLPPQLRWNTFRNADWIAYALKLPGLSAATRQQIASADGLRAAILRQGYGLPINDFASLTETRNALLWQQLCEPEMAANLQQRLPELRRQAFNQGTVMAALLNELLQVNRPLPWGKALSQLVAKVADAKQTAPDALRVAILRQALLSTPAKTDQQDAGKAGAQAIEHTDIKIEELTLPEFARITLQAAKETKDGRFGDNKVFISKVWETLQQRLDLELSLGEFKQCLLAANQQRFLTLSRADMAYALDPEDVSASEINHMASTVHFITFD